MSEALALDPGRQERARQYARQRRRLFALDLLLGGLVALAWIAFGWAAGLETALRRATNNDWLLVAVFGVTFFMSFQVFGLPLAYYSSYVLPHRFGQSTQTSLGWLRDVALEGALSALLGLPLLEAAYWLLRTAGPSWWLWAGAGFAVLTIIISGLAPTLILPIFNKYVPLEADHSDLVQRLHRLAARAGTRVSGVFRFDMSRRTRAANAALTGIGPTRRILLGDTLLNSFTPDEIEAVIAHELGHHVNRDIPTGIVFSSGLTIAGLFVAARVLDWGAGALGLASSAAIAGLPLLALILGIFGTVTLPLNNAYSRWREVRADRFALTVTGKPQAFADAMTRLANQNLADVDPEPWVVFLLYSHPPIRQRLALAAATHAAG